MKKYIKPVLEVLLIKDMDNVMAAVSPGPYAEGKENGSFFDMDDEEGNDPWGEKPDANKYDLWKD